MQDFPESLADLAARQGPITANEPNAILSSDY